MESSINKLSKTGHRATSSHVFLHRHYHLNFASDYEYSPDSKQNHAMLRETWLAVPIWIGPKRSLFWVFGPLQTLIHLRFLKTCRYSFCASINQQKKPGEHLTLRWGNINKQRYRSKGDIWDLGSDSCGRMGETRVSDSRCQLESYGFEDWEHLQDR